MGKAERQGLFEVIDSFAIRKRNQFYMIGRLKEGKIEENWFVAVRLNGSLSMTIRVSEIEEIERASERRTYTLLTVNGDQEEIDLLLTLDIGLEDLEVTIQGED